MLGTNTRVVETGTDGVCLDDLAGFILQNVCADSVKHARLALRKRGAVLVTVNTYQRVSVMRRTEMASLPAFSTGLHADELDALVWDEVEESAHRVAASTYTRDNCVRKLADLRT